ncbi:hypothetical protein B7494_g3595 [Chlorociboria aeruginascens]|nr:hypothetical protein B7494_g3595 [Chlorociboria aeruginascens]
MGETIRKVIYQLQQKYKNHLAQKRPPLRVESATHGDCVSAPPSRARPCQVHTALHCTTTALQQKPSSLTTIFAVARKMAIHYLILLSRQGKVRLAKWFTTLSPKEKAKIIKDVSQLVLARRTRMCNFLEYKDSKIVYRRYASLFFIAGCAPTDNELITLEIVHRYVEQMDKYYGNVCELDIIFNFQKAYFILDELLLAGEMQESSKKNVLRVISAQDSIEDTERITPKVTPIRYRHHLPSPSPIKKDHLNNNLILVRNAPYLLGNRLALGQLNSSSRSQREEVSIL